MLGCKVVHIKVVNMGKTRRVRIEGKGQLDIGWQSMYLCTGVIVWLKH